MCIKKEYKCYKGKETEDCCNAKIEEAVRNRTYFLMLILGIILMIISLVIKTSKSTVFVNQVSFASTITSIILSVIAIWMSITGERSTSEIKSKVSESVDRLLKTSSDSDKLVTDLSNMLLRQNESYNSIKNQMEAVLLEIGGVKSTVISLSDSFVSSKQNLENIPDNICLFFQNIVNGIPDKGVKERLYESYKIMFDDIKDNPDKGMLDVYHDACDSINMSEGDKRIMYGIFVALAHNGFFEDDKNYEYLIKEKNKINKQ